jgi:hypothetical protein
LRDIIEVLKEIESELEEERHSIKRNEQLLFSRLWSSKDHNAREREREN